MIEALELVSTLLSDQPENAPALLQLITWLRSSRGDQIHEAEADAIEEFVYSKTEDCAHHLEAYKKSLQIHLVSATSAGS